MEKKYFVKYDRRYICWCLERTLITIVPSAFTRKWKSWKYDKLYGDDVNLRRCFIPPLLRIPFPFSPLFPFSDRSPFSLPPHPPTPFSLSGVGMTLRTLGLLHKWLAVLHNNCTVLGSLVSVSYIYEQGWSNVLKQCTVYSIQAYQFHWCAWHTASAQCPCYTD